MPDYADQLIEGSVSQKADRDGNIAAAQASVGDSLFLPDINMPLDYAEKRQEWFHRQIQEHQMRGMRGYYGDLANTYPYVSMRKQLDGYIADQGVLRNADGAYTTLVGPANMASKALAKQTSIQQTLGFEDDTDFEKQLAGSQEGEALRKVLRDNPTLIAKTQAVKLAADEYAAARQTFVGATQAYDAYLTHSVIRELREKLAAATEKKEQIQQKIEKVTKTIGHIETGLKLVAMGAGALAGGAAASSETAGVMDETAGKVKEYAEKGEARAGQLEKVADVALQLYYQKDLDALNATIVTITAEVSAYEGVAAAQQADAIRNQYAGASLAFAAAAQKYKAAIDDRRTSYLQLGRMADAAANHGHEDKKHDFTQQVMLYMESVREARQLVASGQSTAQSAMGAFAAATKQLQHRNEQYQTNYEASGTIQRSEQWGPDGAALTRMSALTSRWLRQADAARSKLDNQEVSAKKVMGDF